MDMEKIKAHAEKAGVSVQLEEMASRDDLKVTLALPNGVLRYEWFSRSEKEKKITDWIDHDAEMFWGGDAKKAAPAPSTISPVDPDHGKEGFEEKTEPANVSASSSKKARKSVTEAK